MRYLIGLMLGLTFTVSALAFDWGRVSAESWLVADGDGKIIQGESIDNVRSIASITKLFTAVTILRSGVDLNEKVKITGRSSGRFPRGMMATRMDLMKAMLISSDNLAAETLANTYPGGFDVYLEDANRWKGMSFSVAVSKISSLKLF